MRKGKQKNTEKTRDIWYELDNAANVFPSISGDDNTNVFRLACELTESVDGRVLQQALDIAIESFPYFQVVMRRDCSGFTWSAQRCILRSRWRMSGPATVCFISM